MRESILNLLACAMQAAETMPPQSRADLLDAAGEILGTARPDLHLEAVARAATAAAQALRDAETHQMTFTHLLQGKEAA
jgi:hypothetical protein